ncbi:MAG: hypothetical protein JWM57_2031 [Phycisphaerales bacterium]|nr:hypothetical protein [Phycisphaerales bacterium]
MSYRIAGLLSGVLALAASAQSTFAAPIFWTPSAGSTSLITYSDGQSDKGLYGNPTVVGNTFQFLTPHDFSASASNGSAETTSDRLSFQASGKTGDFSSIRITEVGDWSILGAVAAAKDTGALIVTDLTPGHFGVLYTLSPTVTYFNDANVPLASYPKTDGSGTWKASYVLTLPAGVASVQIVLNNNLQASSTPSTTSFIQKKSISITVVDPAVPEPASLGMITISGITLLRRRWASV